MTKRISLLLAEDHAVVREGLRHLLDREADFQVVGEAHDGRHAIDLAAQLLPDVVLMDISMPGLNGMEATRQILKALPRTRVLVLSAYGDEAYITGSFEAGAAGFLLKHSPSKQLFEAIRGGGSFRPAAPGVQNPSLRTSAVFPVTPALTPREREVLQLIAEGKANKQVAAVLGISINTVGRHREHIMAKLGIHDTATLTRYAIQAGIVEGGAPRFPI